MAGGGRSQDVDTEVAALARAEERFRTLFAHAPIPIWIYDATTLRFLDVNEAALELYGYTREEFLAMQVTDIRSAEEAQRFLQVLSTMDDEPHCLGVWQHRRKDGSFIDVEVYSQEVTENGRKARLVLALEITARRRAERALRESEERFRAALDLIPDAVALLRLPRLEVAAANGNFGALAGLDEPELVGRPLGQLRMMNDDGAAARLLSRLGGAPLLDVEVRLSAAGGEERTALLSSQAVTIGGDRYALLVLHDITVRKHAEEERRRLQEQLLHAQKMEAVGRLAGGVAHDFNNLMTVVANFSELLLEQALPESARDDVEQIRRAAERATALTRQLLAFSRRQRMELKLVDVHALLGDLEKMLGRLIGAGVELRVRTPQQPLFIRADRGQLEQVIVNLVVNACDAMPAGGRLDITTARVQFDGPGGEGGARAGDYVRVVVSDTGTGMDAETMRRAFEPFFTTKDERGTGLGLSTVYGIVRQHGGHVLLLSEPGRGTSVEVYLPAAEAEAPAESTTEAAAVERGVGTVLVVEDDEQVRQAASASLERSGFRALLAANGDEALAIARGRNDIDAVLADLVLPGIGGREVARQIAALRPGVQIVLMSGHAGEAANAGEEVLEKPFTQRALVAKMQAVLRRGHAKR